MVNAVIYVRPENYGASASRCLEHCAARRYNVVGLIQGDWPAASRMLDQGLASVVVVSSAEQLDPHLEPRIEVVPKPRRQRRSSSSAAQPGRRWTSDNPGSSFHGSPRGGVPARPVPRNLFRS
ncbi:hypothetical protein Ade02nite_91510 [Paractinoplanes deccanensis]|uniref:Uncharacterized protein n=1 Tax=Paractinoplanes deccanensis TaxID=113561 RepID=A0ABQ3YKH9_9ACTN|nr:hypothetical protein Ade02nite_91510 [Actinoplanes deccanensis]